LVCSLIPHAGQTGKGKRDVLSHCTSCPAPRGHLFPGRVRNPNPHRARNRLVLPGRDRPGLVPTSHVYIYQRPASPSPYKILPRRSGPNPSPLPNPPPPPPTQTSLPHASPSVYKRPRLKSIPPLRFLSLLKSARAWLGRRWIRWRCGWVRVGWGLEEDARRWMLGPSRSTGTSPASSPPSSECLPTAARAANASKHERSQILAF
jgi:hypothetical protein